MVFASRSWSQTEHFYRVAGLGLFGFISMMIFLFILTIGFIYEWKKGALDWE